MNKFSQKIIKLWYQSQLNPWLWPLIPFSFIMQGIVCLRRWAYQRGIFKQHHFKIPIIIIGNITVGGTGKTPLVIHVAKLLTQHGFKPGIVSRGYGRKKSCETSTMSQTSQTSQASQTSKISSKKSILVQANSDPKEVGDEPVLMAKRLFCPIVVDANRVRAVETLLAANQLATHQVDVIILDDGLQHYALGRTIEVVVVDGMRRFGNGWILPAGPLREPMSRLNTVDFIVSNGPESYDSDNEYEMELRPRIVFNGENPGEQKPLISFQGQTVHAVAAIGHPERFFSMLAYYGLNVIPHPFPDHYQFQPKDIDFHDGKHCIMTEKDAVKCSQFMKSYHWVLSVDAIVNPLFDARILTKIEEYKDGQKTS